MNWQRIAQKRLVELRTLRRRCDLLRYSMADEIEKEIIKNMHSNCLPREIWQYTIRNIAEAVADRLKPEVP